MTIKRKRVQLSFNDSHLTHQEFKEPSLIRNIVKRHVVENIMPDISPESQFVDVSQIEPDYLANQLIIKESRDKFSNLPENVKKAFNYNAKEFAQADLTQEGQDKLISLGLATKKVVEEIKQKQIENNNNQQQQINSNTN